MDQMAEIGRSFSLSLVGMTVVASNGSVRPRAGVGQIVKRRTLSCQRSSRDTFSVFLVMGGSRIGRTSPWANVALALARLDSE